MLRLLDAQIVPKANYEIAFSLMLLPWGYGVSGHGTSANGVGCAHIGTLTHFSEGSKIFLLPLSPCLRTDRPKLIELLAYAEMHYKRKGPEEILSLAIFFFQTRKGKIAQSQSSCPMPLKGLFKVL